MRISDWSSDVCSSDLPRSRAVARGEQHLLPEQGRAAVRGIDPPACLDGAFPAEIIKASLRDTADARTGQRDLRRHLRGGARDFDGAAWTGQDRCRCGGKDKRQCRSEEHTSELTSLMRNSYAVVCLKKKNKTARRKT